MGIAGFTSSTYVDLPFNAYAGSSAGTFFWGGIVSSALEHGVIEQTQAIEAVSTIELLNVANSAGMPVYELTQSNQATIKPLLTGYITAQLDSYLSAGFKLIIPQSANLTVGNWTGNTFMARLETGSSSSGAYIIGGGLNGGFGSIEQPDGTNILQTFLTGVDSLYVDASNFVNDPIDFSNGQFVYDADDIAVGSGGLPFSIGLQRSYHSANRLKDGPLGLGWTHNFDISLTTSSNAYQGMGKDTAIHAAGFIIASYVSTQLLQIERSLPRLMVSSIISKWIVDNFTDNQIIINAPGNNQQFNRLPNGEYQAAPGSAAQLSDSNGLYQLRMKNGVEMTFASDNKINNWQDANGNALTFSYTSGKLSSVSNDVGRSLSFNYLNERIQNVTDDSGRQINYQYDLTGNLIHFNNALNEQTRYEYDIAGRMEKVFLPETPTQALVINEYDTLDRIKRQTNALGKDFHYYLSGDRSEEIDPIGTSTKIWYFDRHGKVEQQSNALGRTVFSDYDGEQRLIRQQLPEGNAIEYDYDQNHNLIQIRLQSKGTTPSYLTTTTDYELTYNQPIQQTDARGKVTNFEYYLGSPNLKRILQPALENNIRPEISYTYNSRGQVETATDPEGRVLLNSYDLAGKLESIAVDWSGLNLVTAFGYDTLGNIDTTTDPNGNVTGYEYDAERRLTATLSPAPFNYLAEIDYDKNGRIIEQRRETGNAINPLQIVQTSYTPSDKLKKIINEDGHVTNFEYDDADRLIKTIDAENRVSENAYYLDGRVYRQYRYLDGVKITVAEYDYTENGQARYLEDANGNRTDYTYDIFDRLERTSYPDASYQQASYDNNGNINSIKTRAGDTIDYDYDALNRRINKNLAGTASDVSYQYDLSGLSLVVVQASGNHSYSYDTAGRLTQEIQPDGKTIQQEYDANGNRSVLIYPDGYTLNYSHDALNRLERIDEINQLTQTPDTIASFDYIDRLNTQLIYANGVNLHYENSIGGKLEHRFGSNMLVSYDLLHNKVGELINRNISGTDYDWQPSSEQVIDYSANELNQYDSIKFAFNSYDNNGNFITDNEGTTYSYDHESRMTGAVTPLHTINYFYDAFGRRIQKNLDTQITRYSYDGNEVLAEYDGGGQMTARYVYGAGIDQPLVMERGGNRYYYHPDPQGSIAALSDSSGTVVQKYAYGPFGEGTTTDAFDNPYRYTARRYDEETGLYYYRARYYNPEWGRFLQADPSGYGDGLNLYAYVGNSPVSFVDPSGLTANEIASRGNDLLGELSITAQATMSMPGVQVSLAAGAVGTIAYGVTAVAPLVPLAFDMFELGSVASGEMPLGGFSGGSIRNVNRIGGQQNCANCAIATDATLAGNPASALNSGITLLTDVEKYFGGTFGSLTSQTHITNRIGNLGDGARAVVFGSRGSETGHFFNVVNQNGIVRFLDGQTGTAADLSGFEAFSYLRTN